MDNKRKQLYRNSDLLAMFIAETLICSVINVFANIPYISVWVTIMLMVSILINNQWCISIRLSSVLSKVTMIIAILVISMLINGIGEVIIYAINFLCFGTAAIVFLAYEFDVIRLVKTLNTIYLVYIVFYILFIRDDFLGSSRYWDSQMGMAYGFVPMSILLILVMFYPHLYNGKKILPMSTGVVATYFLLVDTGTRGALVVAVIGIACIGLSKQTGWKKISFVLAISVFLIICIQYYQEILISLEQILSLVGIKSRAISKAFFMIAQNNESNGRDRLYKVAQECFMESPIIGHGVGYFEKEYGTYPHNIFWQLLCEYGLCGLLVIGVFVINKVKRLFFAKKNDVWYLEIFLFVCTIPMLFFSNTYWLIPMFWIFFFIDKKQLVYKRDEYKVRELN